MSRAALAKAGGLDPLVEYLAERLRDGKERIAKAGYRVELCGEVVETTVPAYSFSGVSGIISCGGLDRRGTRASWGYIGLGITYALPWAIDDLRCERVCAVELFAVERWWRWRGWRWPCRLGWGVCGWPGAARSVAAALAGFLWAGLLGVELCRGYGGVAG